MREFIKDITDWYFSRRALPYWCILVIDCFFVILNGYIGLFLTRQFVFSDYDLFWENTWGLLINTFIFAVSFKLFHTYHGVVRYSTFHDLASITSSTLSASIVAYGLSKLLRYLGVTVVQLPNFYGEFILFVGVTMCMFLVRVLVKFLFYKLFKNQAPCLVVVVHRIVLGRIVRVFRFKVGSHDDFLPHDGNDFIYGGLTPQASKRKTAE